MHLFLSLLQGAILPSPWRDEYITMVSKNIKRMESEKTVVLERSRYKDYPVEFHEVLSRYVPSR